MNNYQKICKNFVMPIGDRLFGLQVSRRQREIEKFQWLKREKIEAYQLKKLKDLIYFVSKNVPYYQNYFRAHNLKGTDFQTLKDLKKLPIITKTKLRENFDELKVPNFNGKIYEMKSSGSTGQQTTVYIDNAVNTEVLATQLLFWSWGGFFMGKPHLQTGMSLSRGVVKRLKDYLFRCTYTSAFELTDKAIEKIIGKIQRKKIEYIFGYASSIFVIAKYLKKMNLKLGIKKIFTWGDCLFPHYREIIENNFNSKVIDCYGLGEGLQIACQCEMHEDLHIAEHHTLVEIIDPNSQIEIGKDEYGRVIVTRFEAGPMPLLRYDTGDISSISSISCRCGRNLKLISRVLGRDTDIIQSPSGDKLIVHFFTQLFEMKPEIKRFQVRQEKLSELDIYYVPDVGFEQKILELVKEEINENCVYNFKMNFKAVKNIPLEKSNKRRFVISNIKR